MRRNILFNNKANEVTLEAVARKEVPYYIRRKLTGSNDSYIQKKRDGRCIGYAIVNDDWGVRYKGMCRDMKGYLRVR